MQISLHGKLSLFFYMCNKRPTVEAQKLKIKQVACLLRPHYTVTHSIVPISVCGRWEKAGLSEKADSETEMLLDTSKLKKCESRFQLDSSFNRTSQVAEREIPLNLYRWKFTFFIDSPAWRLFCLNTAARFLACPHTVWRDVYWRNSVQWLDYGLDKNCASERPFATAFIPTVFPGK
jgi:hypothetical protein